MHFTIETRGFKYDVGNLLRKEYSLSHAQATAALQDHNICFLIDNYQFEETLVNGRLLEMIGGHRFVMTGASSFLPVGDRKLDGRKYQDLYLHDLTRKQIRELTEKWPTSTGLPKDEIISKVTSIFSQLHISCSYWNVSLFLWIFEKTANVNIQNNVELVDLYVENLLEKTTLSLDVNKVFSYENFKDFLAEFAYFLYQDCESKNYSCSYLQMVGLFERFQKTNPRIVARSKLVIDYVLNKGIVVETISDGFTFRLNGIFEYFLAHKMRSSPAFRNQILESDSSFLSFRNEFELYSGLVRNDHDLMQRVYYNALTAFDHYFTRFPEYRVLSEKTDDSTSVDRELQVFIAEATKSAARLDSASRDLFEDSVHPVDNINSSVTLKERYEIKRIDTEMLAKHVHLLGRVFRNMDNLSDLVLLDEVFRFVVQSAIFITRFTIEDMEKSVLSPTLAGNDLLLDLFQKMSPLLSHSFLSDSIAHRNLVGVVELRLREIADSDGHDVETLLLNFMIIDTGIEAGLARVDELTSRFQKKPFLLNSIMLLLVYHLVFKTTSDRLEKDLRQRILVINAIVNPNDKSATLLQSIDKFRLKESLKG